ncbi:MAG: DUF642 domain-containing protein [Verrucomicrobiaceae bacterium]|nr:MAG: DUF642 domain-containing protein [Verrucomicrobiaceae bacterium]
MKSALPRLSVCLTFAFALCPSAGSAAVVLVNGGLEMATGHEGLTITVNPGVSYNGWTSTGGAALEFVGVTPTVTPSAGGNGFVDLNGTTGPGTLSQSLNTAIGQMYRVDFSLSGNPGLNDRLMDKPMSVTWNGVSVGSFVFQHLPTDHLNSIRWEDHSVFVTAVNGSDVLSFMSTGGANDAGAMIDEVSITPVPEPASLALASFGLLALRRRRA